MDNRIRETIFPKRIVASEGNFTDSDNLLTPADMQIGLDETHLTRVKGKGFLILDFGKELQGGVRILTQLVDGGQTRVRLRLGESVSECCAELGEKGAGNHHALRDIRTELLIFSDQEFFQSGFRFLRIDFLEDDELLIKSVAAVSVHRDLHPIGSFVCDDRRVNEIFRVAADTLMLNMQNFIWDGIKRDRLVWIGDMHPETTAIACLFGSDPSVERSLTYCKDHTPLPQWMNHTCSYTVWWVIILYDYFMNTNNIDYVREQQEYLSGAMKQISGVVSQDGTMNIDLDWLFDWPSHESEDERVGIHALMTLGAYSGRELMKYLNMDTSVCDDLLIKLQKKQYVTKQFKQCEAFRVYAGIESAEKAYPFLTRNGARGFSTFLSYYLLCAVSDFNDAKAVELMKEYYGGMLDLGATSFWEDFDLDWMQNACPIDRLPKTGEKDIHGDYGKHCYVGFRHSLCHGWSCGPVPFLTKKLAGIEPVEPGLKKVRISPKSGGLKWYEIKYPTPYGPIEVTYRGGTFNIKVPDGVTVVE